MSQCGTTIPLLFSRALPGTAQAFKTIAVQMERLKGEKTVHDSHRQFREVWKTGCPWLDFRKVAFSSA